MNKNFTAFCAAMLAFAIMFVICGGFVNNNTFSLADEGADQKTVYLTFDDGPSDKVTPKILDVLKSENVKATFFIIGNQAVSRKNILKREFDEGHTIAVHSYTHRYGEIYSSAQSLLNDIDKCNEIIKSVTGEYSSVYRFPGGSFGLSEELISAVTAHGMRYVDWNASTRDAEIYGATPKQLLNCAVSTSACADNVVLLSHDSTSKTTTADALKDIIKYFKNEGYTFKVF
ncbi:MAG: polysaccharide deacetylase [Clostridia bacterium]|nr:polysaccharide deacetylase [Clostridia bacterium]